MKSGNLDHHHFQSTDDATPNTRRFITKFGFDAHTVHWHVWAFALGFSFLTAQSSAQTPIRVSIQPGAFSMLPLKVASSNGYWTAMGLQPSFVSYAAGVPQIKANADWDVGITGTVPALIGARDFNLITIAVADDSSSTNMLMAKPDLIVKIKEARAIPKNTRIVVTPNSTADYAVQTCLALWGGNSKSEMQYKPAPPLEVISTGAAGEVDMVGLWAPHAYTMQEKHGFKPLCTAKDFGPGIFAAMVARKDYATTNPIVVTKFLAVMMRATNWIHDNPAKAQQMFLESAAKEGVTISPLAAKTDYEIRPLFELRDQLELMGVTSKDIDNSKFARSFYSINIFINEGKLKSRNMKPSSFIDTSYIEKLQTDSELSKFAKLR
jgi:ABC-type nitrate/sulfonate/bicarbonate transport system substrate-binding protein